jgi:hypothetical protein
VRVWKFIWLRPLTQAAAVTAFLFFVVWISGSSNAQGLADWVVRSAEVFAGFYLLFVGLAALAWRKAAPMKNSDETEKS